MILQRLVFPDTFTEETDLLYFRLNGNAKYDGRIVMKNGSTCVFNTYFGSFSFQNGKNILI